MRHLTPHPGAGATASLMLVACLCAGEAGAARQREGGALPRDAPAPQAPMPGTSRQIEADLVVEPRAAAPGAAVKLLYTISSYEAQDERVRVRIEAGPGWKLLDSDIDGRELLLEKWENIEGELYLMVPENARVGDRQLVRLLVELPGESGVVQAQAHVSVSRRGGAKPGVPMISGTATAGVSRLGAGGFGGTQKAWSVTTSTRLGRVSTFSIFLDRGLRENLSNFRFEEQRTRLSGNLRHAGWDVTFGNYLPSAGHALAGPYVLGRGVNVSRPAGRLIAELAAAEPNTIGGAAGGHLLRGRVGMRTSRGSVAIAVSEFGRPMGGYTTLAAVQQTLLDAESEERIEVERRVTASAASNRVTGLGLDMELHPAPHRFTVRTGGLWLSNAAGARAGGLAAEAAYAYASEPAAANVRWRTMPPTVRGISVLGDELAADGSLRLAGPLRIVGNVYRNDAETIDSDLSSSGGGWSAGVRVARGKQRLEVRGNVRDTRFTTRAARHTVSVGIGVPVGPLSLSAVADVGQQVNAWGTGRIAFYRADLRWARADNTITITGSHAEGSGARRQRVDLLGALKLRAVELAGGAWATRGYASGGRPGVWTTIGVPVGGGRFVTVGVDYSSLTWTAAPSLRGLVTVRQAFAVPLLPFQASR